MLTTQSTLDVIAARDGAASSVDKSIGRPVFQTTNPRPLRRIKGPAAAVGKFLLHYLEMVIAMAVGMVFFWPFKNALVDQGYTILLDRSSIEFQAWMNLFMVVPMVLWMRLRGHRWRHGAEMSAAMVLPVAVILFACSLGIESTFPWFTTGLTGIAMFLGMLGYMLYRREMYAGNYFPGWSRPRQRGREQSGASGVVAKGGTSAVQ